jgi:hypothetical protein
MFQSSNIWGNIISYTVLRPTKLENASNLTIDITICGVNDCPNSNDTDQIKKPDITAV